MGDVPRMSVRDPALMAVSSVIMRIHRLNKDVHVDSICMRVFDDVASQTRTARCDYRYVIGDSGSESMGFGLSR